MAEQGNVFKKTKGKLIAVGHHSLQNACSSKHKRFEIVVARTKNLCVL